MPFTRGKKPTVSAASRLPKLSTRSEENLEGSQVKRSSSPPTGAPKKRTAFIDITNAHKVGISLPGRKKEASKKIVKKSAVASSSVSAKNQVNLIKSSSVSSDESSVEIEKTEEVKVKLEEQEVKVKQEVQEVKLEVQEVKQEVKQEVQEDTATPVEKLESNAAPSTVQKVPAHLRRQQIPAEFDIDAENREDCVMCPEYAKDIFDYLKQREEKFVLPNYMSLQSSLNPEMRAILIDWLVEVQENFELYHETLYLAVKMTDHYLSKASVHREMLQLVGSTAMLIASKFEERSPPCVDDFLYICDDAYKKEELISMESSILQTLSFDINIPISYRFLRRYAKCVNAGMDTLTLARYFCEMSLLEMDLVVERGSLLASACLLLALLTKDLGGWTPCLQFHSGYDLCDLSPVVRKLYFSLSAPLDDRLKAIRNKYSHKVFFEVAKLPLVDLDMLENALLKKEKTEEPV
ncbi:G2/mitotic-specific cyclin-B3 isoform X2 [Boleophthalmus pectinirostris]|uniref:G2/mitotic-specific cyclin-B3 isoform X2 n=1 Tax=Boleophthalmus pectinirostris TaxID=150288 RepID=UPI00242D1C1F|nr:G2/mitotic-specific cyclin-B3 isoform X2 [Boleophthalmus pectinirostris]XP_055012363.1 G2/mitotic-specific cyclin-B3 isoform X2 [Boleophthalmus pectinirostris]